MKVWELASGIRIPLAMEEHDLVEKLMNDEDCILSERQEVIAQTLTNKGILIKEEQDDGECEYKINYHVDVWRD